MLPAADPLAMMAFALVVSMLQPCCSTTSGRSFSVTVMESTFIHEALMPTYHTPVSAQDSRLQLAAAHHHQLKQL